MESMTIRPQDNLRKPPTPFYKQSVFLIGLAILIVVIIVTLVILYNKGILKSKETEESTVETDKIKIYPFGETGEEEYMIKDEKENTLLSGKVTKNVTTAKKTSDLEAVSFAIPKGSKKFYLYFTNDGKSTTTNIDKNLLILNKILINNTIVTPSNVYYEVPNSTGKIDQTNISPLPRVFTGDTDFSSDKNKHSFKLVWGTNGKDRKYVIQWN